MDWIVTTSVILLAGLVVVVAVMPYPPKNGAKSIEADGVTYIGCSGVLWFAAVTQRDPANTSYYDVFFKDVDGRTRELQRVRTLRVTDLPKDFPACIAQHK